MEPRARQLVIPAAYGAPAELLPWAPVSTALLTSLRYWLSTVRPDGRPHTVPVDGLWVDDTLVVGGDTATVHSRNLTTNTAVTVHLPDADTPTIVEGVAQWLTPPERQARSFAAASKAKYGYAPPAAAFRAGVWQVRPRAVLAWTDITRDATRFTFG
jgi:hypothetical protein